MASGGFGSSLFGGPGSSIPTLTPANLIYTAYRIAGLLSEAARGASDSEQTEGLAVLNSLIDAWYLERLLTWAVTENYINIVPNKVSYSIGTYGTPDIYAARPLRIDQAGLLYIESDTYNVEVPLNIRTYQEWQSISPKLLTATQPSDLYYLSTVPNGTIFLWPIPTQANQFTLYLWQALSQFTSLTQSLQLPQGYQRMIEYNLAAEFADRFPTRAKMLPGSYEKARTTKLAVKAINALPLKMQCEAGDCQVGSGSSHYNIFSNEWTPNA